MKSRIKKIILLTAALIFLGTGIFFAHERHHKPPGHAYGQQKQKEHPIWNKKHHGPKCRITSAMLTDMLIGITGIMVIIGTEEGMMDRFLGRSSNVTFQIVVKDFDRR